MTDDPFRFINSILETNDYCFQNDDDEREFNPFLTNRALSQHIDSILHVAEVAKYPDLPKKAIYDYYFHSIRKMKRKRAKWPKKVEDADIEMISQYYQVSYLRAEEYAKVLKPEDIESIRLLMTTGG